MATSMYRYVIGYILCVEMCSYVWLRVCAAVYDNIYVWLCMTTSMYGCVGRLCMATSMCGCVWPHLCIAMCGNVQLCMATSM